MAKKKVLLAGEAGSAPPPTTRASTSSAASTFHLGAEPLVEALAGSDFDLAYMPAHEARPRSR